MWAGRLEQTRSTSSASILLFSSTSPSSLRIKVGTVGINNDTQLVAASNFAPVKKSPFAAFSILSRASVLQGLKTNPECTGLIFPISVGEIDSFLTMTSRMLAGESFRHSCS